MSKHVCYKEMKMHLRKFFKILDVRVLHAKFLRGKENKHASHFLQNHNPLIPRVSTVSGPSTFYSDQQMRKQSHQKAL